MLWTASGCGTVGKAVTSDTRHPLFNSSHRQILITFNCIEEKKIKKKEAEMAHLKNTSILNINWAKPGLFLFIFVVFT